jgi:hypothetical protein
MPTPTLQEKERKRESRKKREREREERAQEGEGVRDEDRAQYDQLLSKLRLTRVPPSVIDNGEIMSTNNNNYVRSWSTSTNNKNNKANLR